MKVESIRHRAILKQIVESGFVTHRQIADDLGVSVMTARRDIQALAKVGFVAKVHGGAKRVNELEPVAAPNGTSHVLIDGAIESISAGMTVGIVAGHFAVPIALALAQIAGVTIVTNSTAVSRELGLCPLVTAGGVNVVLLPGVLDRSGTAHGHLCHEAVAQIFLNVTFCTVHGFDETTSSFTESFEMAQATRAFAASSSQIIGLAHVSGLHSMSPSLLPVSLFGRVLIEGPVSEFDLTNLLSSGVRLAVGSPARGSGHN